MLFPRLEMLPPKKLIGKRLNMSFANNQTSELWRSFMPYRREIKNATGIDLFSLQNYTTINSFQDFNPDTIFEKWAAIEVADFDNVPEEMETFVLEGGLYAVFDYKGNSPEIFQYIFREWLPNSEYELAYRPHFEILGEKYKNNDPDSEEEIWIPIKKSYPDGNHLGNLSK
jgi:AraC family transcriptional regulator